MNKPDNVHEFDGYDFPYDPTRTKVLTKDEENKLLAELSERVKKSKAEQGKNIPKKAMGTNANNTVSISITAPKVSAMETSR